MSVTEMLRRPLSQCCRSNVKQRWILEEDRACPDRGRRECDETTVESFGWIVALNSGCRIHATIHAFASQELRHDRIPGQSPALGSVQEFQISSQMGWAVHCRSKQR